MRIAIKTGLKDRVIVKFWKEKVDIWKKMCNFAPKKCITMVDVVSIASYISERYMKEYGERIDEMKLHKLLMFELK